MMETTEILCSSESYSGFTRCLMPQTSIHIWWFVLTTCGGIMNAHYLPDTLYAMLCCSCFMWGWFGEHTLLQLGDGGTKCGRGHLWVRRHQSGAVLLPHAVNIGCQLYRPNLPILVWIPASAEGQQSDKMEEYSGKGKERKYSPNKARAVFAADCHRLPEWLVMVKH